MSQERWEGPAFLWGERAEPTAVGAEPLGGQESSDVPRPAVVGVPGEVGLWVFILGDMTVFGAFFAVLMVENRGDRDLFAASSATLLKSAGAANTIVLLLASYLVVLALHAHRAGTTRPASWFIVGAGACAATFAGVKAIEWTHSLSADHTPGSNDFFTLYFVLTGVHLLHVVIGSVLLAVWWRRLRRDAPWGTSRGYVESAAVYWHMVDLLWIAIFTLAYLVPST